jgi:hypothetical protein
MTDCFTREWSSTQGNVEANDGKKEIRMCDFYYRFLAVLDPTY